MRHRRIGRGDRLRRWGRAGGHAGRAGGDLTDPAGAIRPAVEAALAVARAGLDADPPVPPPSYLRPYVGFTRQTPKSLAAVARGVDQDDEFRQRVAAAVTEDEVGRAGWLWLTRPPGWEGELAAIEDAARARAAEEAEERAERSATRKLASAQAALERAETDARSRLAELDEARGDLAREQAARRAAEARVGELDAQIAELGADRAEVVRNLKGVEARLVERSTELNAARARIRELEAELQALRAGAGPGAGEERPAPPAAGAGPPAVTGVAAPAGVADAAAVVGELARAAQGAAALAEALDALAHLLEGAGAPSGGVAGAATPQGGARAPAGVTASPAGDAPGDGAAGDRDGERGDGALRTASVPGDGEAPAAVAGARRVPVALPGGMFDDSPEAAAHLLRTPGAVLVVDGYNVTMAGWPELPVADQRRRLVSALSDLAHRTATPVEVVFDGAEVEPLSLPGATRQMVRVRFSEPGVEADDVVIDLVGRIPAATPVIVASSDRRVRDGTRRRGANVVHARQLLELLTR